MPKTVTITMTQAGFEVTIGGRTDRFARLDDAVALTRERLGRAQHVRELSALID